MPNAFLTLPSTYVIHLRKDAEWLHRHLNETSSVLFHVHARLDRLAAEKAEMFALVKERFDHSYEDARKDQTVGKVLYDYRNLMMGHEQQFDEHLHETFSLNQTNLAACVEILRKPLEEALRETPQAGNQEEYQRESQMLNLMIEDFRRLEKLAAIAVLNHPAPQVDRAARR